MEEHQLKELAYTIFFGACGKRSNAEHVQVMRAQLEVSSRAKRPNKSMYKHLHESSVAAMHHCQQHSRSSCARPHVLDNAPIRLI